MNDFVSYLNSFNSAGSDTTGSLAEKQVKSKYFESLKVNRKLGSYIADSVRNQDYQAFILTGHAGDGKTSILVQVLKELGLLGDGEGLETEKTYPHLYYVKDMSEVKTKEHLDVLKTTLQSPQYGRSSVLISNTGPLLEAFKELAETNRKARGLPFTSNEKIELQSTILRQLDKNSDQPVSIEGYKFTLVNIARLDNIIFSVRILQNILKSELWTMCSDCQCRDRCPIIDNVSSLTNQFERVSSFVKNYFRYLYEMDKRLTIRQMLAQLSFAITGNLTCDYIENHYLNDPFFRFNFANLFFGYNGTTLNPSALQIKGIDQLRILSLDKISLDADHKLFVNRDYSYFFTNHIAQELSRLSNRYRNFYKIPEDDLSAKAISVSKEANLRQAIRRYYLIYGVSPDQSKLTDLFDQIFGKNFSTYVDLIEKKQPKQVLRRLQNAVYKAMYIRNVGALPRKDDPLPLTLRRENDVFQNVLLVLGKVQKEQIEICQVPSTNKFEDTEGKNEVRLKLIDEEVQLSFPMITYFTDLINGSIASNDNPALTHGIARIDTILLDKFGQASPESIYDCELQLIVNTTEGQSTLRFDFDASNKLEIV